MRQGQWKHESPTGRVLLSEHESLESYTTNLAEGWSLLIPAWAEEFGRKRRREQGEKERNQ